MEFRFRENDFTALRAHLLRGVSADEEAAILLAGQCYDINSAVWIVKEMIPVPDAAFRHKGTAGLTIDPDFLAPVIKRARLESLTFVLCHSHPFSTGGVGFSGIDDAGEAALFPKIQERVPGQAVGAMVFGQDAFDARVWLPERSGALPIERIRVVGDAVQLLPTYRAAPRRFQEDLGPYDRQILVFTEGGQRLIGNLHVGIVGLGGIGSQVLQTLLHLGVRRLTLVDPDVVETSNLSRLIGATSEDARKRRAKVAALTAAARRRFADAEIHELAGDVYDLSAARRLRLADVVFCCTDTMVSRMVLSRLPAQYYVPVIDLGINIQVENGQVHRIGGRVMGLLPDDPCLDCLGYLDHEALERELAEVGLVARTPYVTGLERPEPAVVSYNAVVASLGVNEFLRLFLPGFPRAGERTFQVFDGIFGVVRRVLLRTERKCGVCTEVQGRGDSVALPCRLDR
jgi:molybdopterin/thiamine biosynthesis adenylyltransferase